MLHFCMYILENIRKHCGFLFIQVYRENIRLKWVSLFNYKLLELKRICSILFSSSRYHFSTMVYYVTPWKQNESFGSVSNGLEMKHWSKIRYVYIFGTNDFYFARKECILCEICSIWTLKTFLKNTKFGSFNILSQKEVLDFALKLLEDVHH